MNRRLRPFALICGAAALAVSLALAQGNYKIEPAAAPASPDMPAAAVAGLQAQGEKVVDAQGTAVCEVWLAKDVATSEGSGGDAVYPSLAVGTWVGIIRFAKAGADFRGQAIKPGTYTLRYAHIPQDGNHMGVNPYPDFLLLSSASADTELSQPLKLADLLKLSRQASGTPHPAVMSLIPVKEGTNPPSLVQDDQGHWALEMKLGTKGGSLPVALIVVGQTTAS